MGGGASTTVKESALKFLGDKLLKGDTEIDTATAFEGKKAVALYFSAHWCPPCRGFTPKLAEWYTKDLSDKGLEVVFISSDRDEAGFKDYYKDMPWLALPFASRDLKATLSNKFKVNGIPSLVIINAEDGSVITKDGRSAVSGDPTGVKFPWIPPTFKEALGAKFLKGDEEVGEEAIKGKHLGLYFSAHWCPPCRGFTPKLAEWYKGIKGEVGDKFEIIFCSGDRDESSMKDYYKEQVEAGGDWLCLPYESKDNLDGIFEVSGIPTFIIVDPDGKVVNKNGRSLVPDKKADSFPWSPPAVGDIESPDGINGTPSIVVFLDSVPSDKRDDILAKVESVAKPYAEAEEPEMLFFAATSAGNVSNQIRGMCGLESAGQQFKQETSNDEAPKLLRTISSNTPTVVLLDLDDNGGYYVGRMAAELDGSGIKQMIQDWKDKKLDRRQLG